MDLTYVAAGEEAVHANVPLVPVSGQTHFINRIVITTKVEL